MLSVLDLRRATWDGSRRLAAYYTDPYSTAAKRNAELNDAFIASFRVEKRLIPTHRGCINAMTLNADATLLATGSDDQDIFLYDVTTWSRQQQIATQHQANIFGCTFVPGHPELLVSCGLDGRFCIQDIEVGNSSAKWKLLGFTVTATFLPESSPAGLGNVCFVTAQDKEVYLYDIREKSPLGVISVVSDPYQSFCVAASDREPNMFVIGGSVITVADYRKMGVVRGRRRVARTVDALFSFTLPFKDRLNERTSEVMEKYYIGDTVSKDMSDPFYFKGRIDISRGRHACSMRFNASATKLLVNVSNGNPSVYDWSSLRSRDPLVDSEVPSVTSLAGEKSKEQSPDAVSEKQISPSSKASVAEDRPSEGRPDPRRRTAAMSDERHEGEEAEDHEEEEEEEEEEDEELEEMEEDDEGLEDEEETTTEESDDSSALLLDAESIAAIRRFPMRRGNPLELGKGVVRTDCTTYLGRANEITMFKEAAFFDDDRYIVTGGDCGKVFFWNEQTGQLVHTIQGDGDVVNGVLTDPRLPVVLACGIDHDVKVLSASGDLSKPATNIVGMFPRARRLGFGPSDGGESSDEWLEVDDSDEEEEEGEDEELVDEEEGTGEDDEEDDDGPGREEAERKQLEGGSGAT